MAGNTQAIKSRIRSVKSTKKITKAMQMIANAKLAKQRKRMETNREYSQTLQKMVDDILSKEDVQIRSPFFTEHKSTKTYTVLFCSDLGLCGGYNANVVKFATANLAKEDPLVIFGTHEYAHFVNAGFNVVNPETSIDALNDVELTKAMNDAIDLYLKDEVGKIQFVYTQFINTVSFEPQINVILPYTKQESEENNAVEDIIFDPSADKVLDNLIVQMVHNVAYAVSLETKTAEQGSRRLAMENATDNAEELEDKLILQYNQARQAAITQEITEIVSGADAL